MIEWFGDVPNIIDIIIPLVGIGVLLIAPKITNTGRSRRYFFPAFVCWFGLQALIGIEEGTLVSFPYPIGLISGILLWIGSLGLFFRGLFAVRKERKPSKS